MSSRLEHTCWLPLFGLPLRMYTNSAALVELIETEHPFGDWARLSPAQVDSSPTLALEIVLGGAVERADGMRLFAHGAIMLGGDGSRVILTEVERGYALACMATEDLAAAVAVIWEIGMLLAHGRGRVAMQAAALVSEGAAVCLIGNQLDTLIQICRNQGLRLLARRVVHIGYGDPMQIWGDGSGDDLLVCNGPVVVCLVEQGAGRASQISSLPTSALEELGSAVCAVRAAYWLRAGSDLEMAATLVEHVLLDA
ncbi:hypothetical protein OSCT_2654 [Oscillochloris trichoides DG-6]|uniref:Uncharacterized protein n=1 Tax=Oscillochloris trichoides DG-6 TaxID=765420 RepID=E1IH53_9CHLR|nr:hypothetical protein [Oscillochloris trichoides]EFO79528.1 hypothetical protein OSCT_2654 [Oscillochloris trichoides DG-6]